MMLNENIREIRKSRNMTQEQLAEAMGVSTASVSKWETGQSAPEITVLMTLADFFEVSVDTLLGHQVKADRRKALLEEMEALADESRFQEAKTVAQKLLRNYPNDYNVVQQVADLYYRIRICTDDRGAMEYSIELVRRLFTLVDDPSGMKRFELLSRLGNQYELLQDWEMARKYYEEGNVSGMNDRSLTRVLVNENKTEEAKEAVSRVFSQGLNELLGDVAMLQQIWTELGQPEKAKAALNWGILALEAAGPAVEKDFSVMGMAMHMQLAEILREAGDMAQAEEHIRGAMRLVCGGNNSGAADFLGDYRPKVIASSNVGSPEQFLQMLSVLGSERYLEVARDEMNKL